MGTLYLDPDTMPDRTAKVLAAIDASSARGDVTGFDTEFYGVDIGAESTCTRAKLHMFSIAIKRFPHVLTPRGYHLADTVVALAPALPVFEPYLVGPSRKAVHNLPVDYHCLSNSGVRLAGGINTLATARWAWPERARAEGFTLDALGEDLVGLGKAESYRELFQERVVERRSTWRNETACECGNKPCRRRQSVPGHARILNRVETVHEKEVMVPVPLEAVTPGHVLWGRAVEYAARDALLALAVYDLAQAAMRVERDVPWLTPSLLEAMNAGSSPAAGTSWAI